MGSESREIGVNLLVPGPIYPPWGSLFFGEILQKYSSIFWNAKQAALDYVTRKLSSDKKMSGAPIQGSAF
jgi:hypothetical protein